MNKAIQMATPVWQRLAVLFAAVVGAGRALVTTCVTKACALARVKGEGKACEITRSAAAGAILFGVAGVGWCANGAIGFSKTAAGATVAVGWDSYWLLWTLAAAAAGAAAGAGTALLARWWSAQRGPRVAMLVVGALGGVLTGATWGTAVARERVVEVQAQPASAAPVAVGNGTGFSVVNGPVRLTGSVARDLNGLLLAFMLGSGALVGVLAARGLSAPKGADETAARPNPQQGSYTA